MARTFKVFASYLLFKEVLVDPLGRLYRAGEFDAGGIRRTVWLRVFDRREVPASDMTAAFDRARRIASALQSANVAAGVDCITENDATAIACDYVASQPLSAVFQRVADERFPIPVDNALLIVEKIALALSGALTVEIEGGRVVHGFLHPGLIFVSNDGEGVVSGFGFGDQLLGLIDDEGSKDLVHPYLAPEVLVTRTASRHGDVYSLGAILFQLLSGSALPADPEMRPQAIAEAHLADDDAPLPDDIKALLLRALADRPEERFSSAADFKKDLDRLLYGGAYSPTTFNLALFMDRLFRTEIEIEEEERTEETAVDVSPFLVPDIEPAPELVLESDTGAGPMDGNRKILWIGLGAAAAFVATVAITVFTITREPEGPALPPTPTAIEIAAQRQAQEEKMRALAEGLVTEMMAVKEEEIRSELLDRQTKIDDLQKKLVASERRAEQGQLTNEDKRRREELQLQIAAEEEAQREKELEQETQRAAEESRRQEAARQTATAVIEEEALRAAAVIPTTVPPTPTTVSEATPQVAENGVVDVSELDSLPVVIKEQNVEWPRTARFSKRQGVVIVQATVNADGLVEDVTILRADDENFGIPEAVMDAVMQYRFKPGIKDGVRVTTHATVTKAYRFVVR
jgi:TonB family protein